MAIENMWSGNGSALQSIVPSALQGALWKVATCGRLGGTTKPPSLPHKTIEHQKLSRPVRLASLLSVGLKLPGIGRLFL